jgi:hypothetical protein
MGEILEVMDEFADAPQKEMNLDSQTMDEWFVAREIDGKELAKVVHVFIQVGMRSIGRGGLSTVLGSAFRLGYELAARRYVTEIPMGEQRAAERDEAFRDLAEVAYGDRDAVWSSPRTLVRVAMEKAAKR